MNSLQILLVDDHLLFHKGWPGCAVATAGLDEPLRRRYNLDSPLTGSQTLVSSVESLMHLARVFIFVSQPLFAQDSPGYSKPPFWSPVCQSRRDRNHLLLRSGRLQAADEAGAMPGELVGGGS